MHPLGLSFSERTPKCLWFPIGCRFTLPQTCDAPIVQPENREVGMGQKLVRKWTSGFLVLVSIRTYLAVAQKKTGTKWLALVSGNLDQNLRFGPSCLNLSHTHFGVARCLTPSSHLRSANLRRQRPGHRGIWRKPSVPATLCRPLFPCFCRSLLVPSSKTAPKTTGLSP